MKQRIQTIFSHCTESVDVIVIKNASPPFIDDNFFYITGLEQGLFEGCAAILHPNGELDLLVSELEAESARQAKANITTYMKKDEFAIELKRLLTAGKHLGVNAAGLSHQEFCSLETLFPQMTIVDVSDAFAKSRLIKDAEEIQRIKKACAIADEAMGTIPDVLYEGMSESELAAEINYSLQSLGAEKPAFDTISSFGKNSAQPHYSHGDALLQTGDFIVCDFGACFRKYNSDITRTFHQGPATEQQREMFETVQRAQQIAFDAIRPGVRAEEVHKAVYSFIEATPFTGRFIHSTGHGLGLAIHDGVGFAPGNTMELREHMVLTVEPGVYLPTVGGVRIEDDILVTKQGMELLTHSSRELIELE